MRANVARPAVPWADELRGKADARRRKWERIKLLAFGFLGAAPALLTVAHASYPMLVWNVTASAPLGLYLVQRADDLRTGEMVVAWPPVDARALAAKRGYVPATVPLVKRIAAGAGDLICAAGPRITVNGKVAAVRSLQDGKGRPLPKWSGCRTLGTGEYLLLMDKSWSFDGRYFGLTRKNEILGSARLLWRR